MSNSPENENGPADNATRPRRGSIGASALTGLFGRSNSTTGLPTAPFPVAVSTGPGQEQRRRMSISTLGLSGVSPTQVSPFGFSGRRGSVSTDRSDSIDESAIDDDDGPARSNPTTPYTRRMSFGAGALRSRNSNSGAGTSGEGGFNWSESLRSRAESAVSQSQRPSFSLSPISTRPAPVHERARSVSEMPVPPTQVTAPAPAPARRERQKPDAFQERILKGDFYMD